MYPCGALLTLRVEDGGPGIPQDRIEAVFEPRCRFEASRNRRTGGSGLTIARRAAERHSGSLTLANPLGRALVATVRLPRPRA